MIDLGVGKNNGRNGVVGKIWMVLGYQLYSDTGGSYPSIMHVGYTNNITIIISSI